MNAATQFDVLASAAHPVLGYQAYTLGDFSFERDEYFVHIRWVTAKGKQLSHTLDAGDFLRALMRDVGWGFFYGWVNFDSVFGTTNHYNTVDVFAGSYNASYKTAGADLLQNFPSEQVRQTFVAMLENWTNDGFDPYAAPLETGSPYGRKHGDNTGAVRRLRQLAARCVGLRDDLAMRTDAGGYPVNRAFADVAQDAPELHPEPGFEDEVHAFNLFAYLSRSDVVWNPSFTSVVKHSYMCPTTEEHKLPIIHGNDRVEWFFQMSDEITWDCGDKLTAEPLARIVMKAGDMAAMPANCRHQGYSPKRSMLLVWENGSPKVVHDILAGKSPVYPVTF
ncbi:MAG: hydroxyquinol 1,2-dioxygenase [Pseudomonadota bacterium]